MDANESIALLAHSLVYIHNVGFCRGQKLHSNGGVCCVRVRRTCKCMVGEFGG